MSKGSNSAFLDAIVGAAKPQIFGAGPSGTGICGAADPPCATLVRPHIAWPVHARDVQTNCKEASGTRYQASSGFGRKSHYLHDALHVICAVVLDFDSALFFAVMQKHAGAKIFLQPRLQMLHRAGIDRN